MSAKGRGRHDGGDVDFYPTPPWVVHRLLDDCGLSLLGVDTALEPTCGDGAIVRACDEWRLAHGLVETSWTGVEIREGALDPRTRLVEHVEGLDFRAWSPPRRFGLALGNPPFNLAESIIRRCLAHCDVVAMLLRVSFLGSEERVDFFRTVGARPALRVLPDRPSFDGIGTDASTYAWFVWGSSLVRGVDYLAATSVETRKAQTPQGLAFQARQGVLW